MFGIRCDKWGNAADLRWAELPDPAAPGPYEVKIKVAAAGVNFADTLIIAGQYQVKPALPFAPGFELAGTVLEVGAGVTHVAPGDRVMALVDHCAFAELALANAQSVFPLPAGMDFVTAAGFPIAYGT